MPLFTNHHAVHINACHALCPEPLCPQFLPAPRQHGSNQGKYYVARKLAFCANKLGKKVFKSIWIFEIYPGARREHPVTTSTFTSVSTSITPSLLVLLSFVVLCPRPFPRASCAGAANLNGLAPSLVRTWPHLSSRRRLITIPTRICIDINIDPVSGLAPILSRNTVINAVSHAGGLRSTPTGTRAVPHAASISCCPVRVMPY
ncbi:hypothetical protein B0H14DRAFT_3624822 [Mycena olivaceomarginata]|nr:hypothetical protein B0H14DRAFT_3624822 [Mycena olivaceomarginata]